jgi:hypothetical protein
LACWTTWSRPRPSILSQLIENLSQLIEKLLRGRAQNLL